MSLRFSRVTLYSAGKTASFLVGGIPKSRTDLQGWTAFDSFMDDILDFPIFHARPHFFCGPSGDNGFDQTTTKPSIYGTCAHFSYNKQN